MTYGSAIQHCDRSVIVPITHLSIAKKYEIFQFRIIWESHNGTWSVSRSAGFNIRSLLFVQQAKFESPFFGCSSVFGDKSNTSRLISMIHPAFYRFNCESAKTFANILKNWGYSYTVRKIQLEALILSGFKSRWLVECWCFITR